MEKEIKTNTSYNSIEHEKKTMDDLYGDESGHEACEFCGYCITCGDCMCWEKEDE